MNLISEAILNNWGKESFQVVHFRRVSLVGIFRDPANSSVNLPHILHFSRNLITMRRKLKKVTAQVLLSSHVQLLKPTVCSTYSRKFLNNPDSYADIEMTLTNHSGGEFLLLD